MLTPTMMLNFPSRLLTCCLPPSSGRDEPALVSVHSCRCELGCEGTGLRWGGEWAAGAACTAECLVLGQGIGREQLSSSGCAMLLQEPTGGRESSPPGHTGMGPSPLSVAALLVWQFNVPTARLIGMATATVVLQHRFEAPNFSIVAGSRRGTQP